MPSPTTATAAHARRAASDDDVDVFHADELTPEAIAEAEEMAKADAAPARLGPVALLLRNPFLWVIVVVSIGLIVWGLSAYGDATAAMVDRMFGGFTNQEDDVKEYVATQVSWGIAPLAVLVGLLAAVGAVFFAAATWLRGRAGNR